MPIIIGGNAKTLIVEADDNDAAYYSRMLKQFPGNTTERVRSVNEAIALLQVDDEINQVCISGRVWTIRQALDILRQALDTMRHEH